MTLQQFVDSYLAHVIAIAALVQVWIIAAWKKWLIRGKAEFYPSGNLEIGFSAFGSTITLPGSIRAINKDVFITEMRVKIIRLADKAEHTFTWRAFKSNKFVGPQGAHENIELATSFTVSVDSPRPVLVFFASENFGAQYAEQANRLRSAWSAFLQAKQPEFGDQFTALLQDPAFVDLQFKEFSNGTSTIDFYTKLNNEFYWQAGDYSLNLEISRAGAAALKYDWKLGLTSEDERRLRINAINTMKELCNIKVVYDFIYKPYSQRQAGVNDGV